MACSTCDALIEKYKSLQSKLSDVLGKVSEYESSVNSVKTNFESVVMNGNPVGSDEISIIESNLKSISDNLNVLIPECDKEIQSIENNCPGENHYKSSVSNADVDGTESQDS